jgi:hypothetical protein
MSRKSGNRFSDKDMRKTKESRAHLDSIQSGCALGMIPKSVQRFSEKIMLEQEAEAG